MTTGRSDGINQPVFSAKEKTQRFEGNPLTFAAARRIVSQKRFWTASLSYVATVMFLVCSLASVSSPPLSNARLCRQVNYPTLLSMLCTIVLSLLFLWTSLQGACGAGPNRLEIVCPSPTIYVEHKSRRSSDVLYLYGGSTPIFLCWTRQTRAAAATLSSLVTHPTTIPP
jgi:hypothetical protein